jgi:hypothetical protein
MSLTPIELEVLKAIKEAENRQLSLSEVEQQVSAGYVESLNLEFGRRVFFEGVFSIIVPVSFNTIVPSMPNPQLPEVILSDPTSTVMVLLDYGKFDYDDSDVGINLGHTKSMLRKMNPSTRIYKDGVFELGGKMIEYLEYFNTGEDGDVFNDYFQMSMNGRNLYCYFYCKSDIARRWRNIFWAMIKSAQFE